MPKLVSAPGPRNASRIASERKAGVSYFDALIVGTGTAVGLAHDGMLEPIEPLMILPEVKDPKEWWGGHIWEDKLKYQSLPLFFFGGCEHPQYLVQLEPGEAGGTRLLR